MRYVVFVNDDERVANGDETSWEDAVDEISELLRSGYFEVEYVDGARDGE